MRGVVDILCILFERKAWDKVFNRENIKSETFPSHLSVVSLAVTFSVNIASIPDVKNIFVLASAFEVVTRCHRWG